MSRWSGWLCWLVAAGPGLLVAALVQAAEPTSSVVQASSPPLVLVAGATGQTGQHVLTQALKAGYRVRGLSRDVERARQIVSGNYEWVAGDVRDPTTLRAGLRGVSYVICTIGATERSGPNSPEFVDYGGVRNLADAAKEAGVQQLVLVEGQLIIRRGGG